MASSAASALLSEFGSSAELIEAKPRRGRLTLCGCGRIKPKSTLPQKLQADERRELALSTNLSEQEVDALYARFRRVAAPNTTMSREQFRGTLGILGMAQSNYLADALYRVFTDGNRGELTYDQFIQHLAIMLRGTADTVGPSADEKLILSFSLSLGSAGIDADGNSHPSVLSDLMAGGDSSGTDEEMTLKTTAGAIGCDEKVEPLGAMTPERSPQQVIVGGSELAVGGAAGDVSGINSPERDDQSAHSPASTAMVVDQRSGKLVFASSSARRMGGAASRLQRQIDRGSGKRKNAGIRLEQFRELIRAIDQTTNSLLPAAFQKAISEETIEMLFYRIAANDYPGAAGGDKAAKTSRYRSSSSSNGGGSGRDHVQETTAEGDVVRLLANDHDPGQPGAASPHEVQISLDAYKNAVRHCPEFLELIGLLPPKNQHSVPPKTFVYNDRVWRIEHPDRFWRQLLELKSEVDNMKNFKWRRPGRGSAGAGSGSDSDGGEHEPAAAGAGRGAGGLGPGRMQPAVDLLDGVLRRGEQQNYPQQLESLFDMVLCVDAISSSAASAAGARPGPLSLNDPAPSGSSIRDLRYQTAGLYLLPRVARDGTAAAASDQHSPTSASPLGALSPASARIVPASSGAARGIQVQQSGSPGPGASTMSPSARETRHLLLQSSSSNAASQSGTLRSGTSALTQKPVPTSTQLAPRTVDLDPQTNSTAALRAGSSSPGGSLTGSSMYFTAAQLRENNGAAPAHPHPNQHRRSRNSSYNNFSSRSQAHARKTVHKILGPKKGLAVHFGHENWNMVLHMMIGIRMAVGRSSNEMERGLQSLDFQMQDKFAILPNMANIMDSVAGANQNYTIFVDYAPFVFRKIRQLRGIKPEQYLRSVGPEQLLGNMILGNLSSLSELSSSGKSGAFFYYTADGHFMIKTVTKDEKELLQQMLLQYWLHIKKYPDSLLIKFFGLHALRVRKTTDRAHRVKERKIYFVVMGNMFNTPFEIHKRYDLKGSTTGRSATMKAGAVLDKEQPRLYFIGVIDILTAYGFRKSVEHNVKSCLHPTSWRGVSCCPPAMYAERFMRFMRESVFREVEAPNRHVVEQVAPPQMQGSGGQAAIEDADR
eukprot:g4883.t1